MGPNTPTVSKAAWVRFPGVSVTFSRYAKGSVPPLPSSPCPSLPPPFSQFSLPLINIYQACTHWDHLSLSLLPSSTCAFPPTTTARPHRLLN